MRKLRWFRPNTWLKGQSVAGGRSYLFRKFSRDLAKARADLEADRTDVDLQRKHNARIGFLESLIAEIEAQPAPRPIIVDADRPRKNTQRQQG